MDHMNKETTNKKSRSKKIPLDAVKELADKSPELARLGELDTKSVANVSNSIPNKTDNNDGKLSLDIDYLKNTRMHFALPCYGGMLTESTFMSFIKFSAAARQLSMEWTIETLVNESLITRGRNTLVAKFMHNPSATHLMFIDSDIGWQSWHPLALLDRKVDIIGGMYPMKTLPLKWVVNGLAGTDVDSTGLQEVSKAGTGFLLIKRDVFVKLREHPAVKRYKNDIALDPVYDQYLCTYFDTAVREGRYLSEDWTFCSNYRDLGGKIYIDKRVLLQHSGSYVFSIEAQNHVLKTFTPMINSALSNNESK